MSAGAGDSGAPPTAGDRRGPSAAGLAEAVRRGERSATAVAREHLERIADRDPALGAFQTVEPERVLSEARAVDERDDRGELPLAGLPVPVKDNVDVAGYPTRHGSRATSPGPAPADHPVVARLRAAGAVVLGKTRLPELGVWGTTDSAFGITRSPADPSRSAGGSSGGSAAAVGAGMCAAAHGNDGLGSIRIPAACCGVVGLKPGAGVVPSEIGPDSWSGLAENGPLARSVAGVALLLSAMAGRPEWRETAAPAAPLRISLSTATPVPGLSPEPRWAAAARRAGRLLEQAGHRVEEADPPYSTGAAAAVLARWCEGARSGAEGLDPGTLESRTRRHVQLGRMVRGLGLVRPASRRRWRDRLAPFFAEYDVLLTPTLAAPPPPAVAWSRRSWWANVRANLRFAPYTAPWNLAGWPAASVPVLPSPGTGDPARRTSSGGAGAGPTIPGSVQLVAPAGGEGRLLAVARQLEAATSTGPS